MQSVCYIISDGRKQKERVHWAALGGVFDVAARIHTCNGVSSNREERRGFRVSAATERKEGGLGCQQQQRGKERGERREKRGERGKERGERGGRREEGTVLAAGGVQG